MRFEMRTDRGEVVQLKLYRAGDATLTVQQAGDWRTAFLSRENVDKLRTFLGSEPECTPFVAEPQAYLPDNFVMSFETAPLVPTVYGEGERR